MIRFENVYKEYDNGVLALQNINLKINPNEFIFLVGKSGAGKSTLVKLLLCEEKATRGKVFFKDENAGKLGLRRVPYYRRQIGTVFQNFRLLPNKTVYENIAYAMEIVGASNRDIRRNVPMMLGLVNLSNKSKSYPDELSGGEAQRVAIARAMVNNPDLLIADEPTGNLDPNTAMDIMKTLEDFNKRGTTIIMATHAMNIVDSLNKRVVELDEGRIVRDEAGGNYHETITNI